MSFMKGKYIIVNSIPVVFSELQRHSDVKDALFGSAPAEGAGCMRITPEEGYVCYGESISLGVKSREAEDSKILNDMLGGLT